MPPATGMMRRIGRAAARRLPWRRPVPAILTYHRVAETGSDPWDLAVTPERFAEQVAYLARRRSVLDLAQFAARLAAGTLPRDAVAITFDDGYVDNLRNAEPILAAAGLPATLFVVSGMVGRPGPFWWDELAAMILDREEPLEACVEIAGVARQLRLPARERADGRGWHWRQRARSARQAVYLDLWSALRILSPDRRDAAMDALRRVAPLASGRRSGRAVTTQELKALADRATFSVGAHTVSHPVLPALGDAERRHEIEAGRAMLRAITGREVPGFAYPYGEVDGPTRDAVARAGFAWACANEGQTGSDPLRLPRLRAPNGGAAALARALASAPALMRAAP